MKKFKQADYFISLLLILVFVIISFINQDITWIIGYFVVGGWQVISMIIHAFFGWFTVKNSRRYVYQYIVLIIIVLALLGLIVEPILVLLAFPMLFAAPVMAIYYTWICYEEVYVKMQRPLFFLK